MSTDALLAELIALLESSLGGITRAEVREMMTRHGMGPDYRVGSVLVRLEEAGVRIWEEVDEENEPWYHLCRPGDTQAKRRVPKMEQRKKVAVTRLDPPAQTKIDADAYQACKLYLAVNRGSMQAFVSQAVREKLAREAR